MPDEELHASPPVLLVDVNNVRGQMNFMPLPDFCSAVLRWAQAQSDKRFVILAVDHGSPTAFRLSPDFAVVFSGCESDADTVLVKTVDFVLSQPSHPAVTVVTHDKLLLRRTQFGLPKEPEDNEWYYSRGLQPPGNPEFAGRGTRRPHSQRERLSVQSSDAFAHTLGKDLQRSGVFDGDDGDDDDAVDAGAAGGGGLISRLLTCIVSLLTSLARWLLWGGAAAGRGGGESEGAG